MNLATLVAVCIPAGDLRWQLNQAAAATGSQLLFDYGALPFARAGLCPHQRIQINQVYAALLAGLPYTWDPIEGARLVTVAIVPIPTCAPELGAAAPLPPCLPPALHP